MNRLWSPILRHLTEAAQPRCLVEIGVAGGLLTGKLLDYCATADAVLHAIDPTPQIDVDEWCKRHGTRLQFHRARSLQVIDRIHDVDMVFLDGDHNWFTVYHELEQLEQTARADGRIPPLITLHDVGWPYARRDLYYDPESIPESHRHPYRTLGVVPGEADLAENGINGDLNNAVPEGSPRNGVRTAVEDFVAGSEVEWSFVYVPGYHGLGVLVTHDRVDQNHRLRDAIASLQTAEFLLQRAEDLELARIRTEIVVGKQQALLSDLQRQDSQMRSEIDALRLSLLSAERDIARLHQLEADFAELEGLTEQLRWFEANYDIVLNSKSWRLTEPLRRIALLSRERRR